MASRVTRLAATLAVLILSLGVISAAAGAGSSKWSASKCEGAYKHWLHTHKHASSKQIAIELSALEKEHKCVFGAK